MHAPKNIVSEQELSHNLLIADPALRDGHFDRSVVYIISHHSKSGSKGLILNNPTGKTVGELIASSAFKPLAHLPVHYGGPVESDQLHFAIFSWNTHSQLSCQTHVSADQASAALKKNGTYVRAFAGHSSWTPGQLHEELEKHAWFTAFSDRDTLDSPQDTTLWTRTLQKTSPFHHILSLTPDNPFLN